jgi:formylmethanofuran dehydrogenase subunit D
VAEKKTSESYFIEHKDCCCEEEDEAPMSDCCKDEVKVVQNISDQVLPVEKVTDVPTIDFVTVFFSIHSNSFNTPLVNSTFTTENQLNQSFDTSPPIRELVCCFVI